MRYSEVLSTLRPRQNGRHFADDTFKHISWMRMLEFLLKFYWSLLLRVQSTIFLPALVQTIALCRPGNKPLSESMMVNLLMHIWLTRPQCVNSLAPGRSRHDLKNTIFNLGLTRTTRMPAFWDTLRCLMITHTSDSHQIPSQNKTKSKLQSLKNWNFGISH